MNKIVAPIALIIIFITIYLAIGSISLGDCSTTTDQEVQAAASMNVDLGAHKPEFGYTNFVLLKSHRSDNSLTPQSLRTP